LFAKLSVTPPSAFLVIRYLEEIAREVLKIRQKRRPPR